jgi:hypothetical protein
MIAIDLIGFLILCNAPTPTIEHVFGVNLSSATPEQLVRILGPSGREVRHYWNEHAQFYTRDDGWDWWHWDDANADIQAYWSPAYPAKKRRIVWIVLCEQFGKGKIKTIHPSGKVAGWLKGFKIGMSQASCVDRFTTLFGKPTKEFEQFVWSDAMCKLELCVEKGKVAELTIEVK